MLAFVAQQRKVQDHSIDFQVKECPPPFFSIWQVSEIIKAFWGHPVKFDFKQSWGAQLLRIVKAIPSLHSQLTGKACSLNI